MSTIGASGHLGLGQEMIGNAYIKAREDKRTNIFRARMVIKVIQLCISIDYLLFPIHSMDHILRMDTKCMGDIEKEDTIG